jgi:DNA-binding CsgD family transcriptional regulator
MQKHQEFAQLILQGQTLAEIGENYDISRQRVSQILKENNISVDALIKQREAPIIDAIKRLALEGLSIGEIANKLKLTYCQVKKRASQNGIKCVAKHGIKKEY